MDVAIAIKQRRSVRSYKPEPVEEEKLNKVLEAARLAPSANNRQDWKFIVVKDEERRKQLAQASAEQMFVAEAPVVIAAVSLSPEAMMRCDVSKYAVDLAIAVDHMTLQAVEEGLGTCWIGAFDQQQVKQILEVPNNYKIVALLPLGYPKDSPGPKIRKEMQEIICSEMFKVEV